MKADIDRLILMAGMFTVMLGSVFLFGVAVDWCFGR